MKGAVRSRELVVLLDEEGRAIGSAPKSEVHGRETPLHLAFSCYVFDVNGELLITQRALAKPTWPGVWTNSFCGHPGPGEDLFEAVHRRAEQELGLVLDDLQLTLPSFRYTAVMQNGVRENELCPVFTAVTATPVAADPVEVEATEWLPWDVFRDEVLDGSRDVSPWCAKQVAELTGREDGRGGFDPAPVEDLPPAARPPTA